MMRAYGLALIPALLGIGGMFIMHIPNGWQYRLQRIAGISLGAILAVLVASGYMLYYVGDEAVRGWTSLIHWAIGLALPAIFVRHYLGGLIARHTRD